MLREALTLRVFNNIFSEKHHDTLFISSGGNTELDQRSEVALAILTKVFKDVEILVLKDRDMSSGRLNDENDRQVYLQNNPENHRVLRRWEIENYLFDKEILKKYSAKSELVFKESDFDAFVADVINQNIKDETNRIKKFCGINVNVNSEQFKLNLSELVTEETIVFDGARKLHFRSGLIAASPHSVPP